MTKRTTPLATPLPNTLTANRFYLHTGLTFPASSRVCNASQANARAGDLPALQAAPARPGADQFRRFKSFGNGC